MCGAQTNLNMRNSSSPEVIDGYQSVFESWTVVVSTDGQSPGDIQNTTRYANVGLGVLSVEYCRIQFSGTLNI